MMRLESAAATQSFGNQLAAQLQPGDIIALSGDLGAGKTCLARGLLTGLGFGGEVASPSFALVIPYGPPFVRLAVAHVDLYRIDGPSQIDELGLDDMLIDGALIVEWPERMGARLWPDALRLRLKSNADDTRMLTAVVPPSWNSRWLYP